MLAIKVANGATYVCNHDNNGDLIWLHALFECLKSFKMSVFDQSNDDWSKFWYDQF